MQQLTSPPHQPHDPSTSTPLLLSPYTHQSPQAHRYQQHPQPFTTHHKKSTPHSSNSTITPQNLDTPIRRSTLIRQATKTLHIRRVHRRARQCESSQSMKGAKQKTVRRSPSKKSETEWSSVQRCSPEQTRQCHIHARRISNRAPPFPFLSLPHHRSSATFIPIIRPKPSMRHVQSPNPISRWKKSKARDWLWLCVTGGGRKGSCFEFALNEFGIVTRVLVDGYINWFCDIVRHFPNLPY